MTLDNSKDMIENGNEEEEIEKKPGIVRKITKITFRIGPIKQEDLSTPELNKLMAMAQRFDISFDTMSILDSDQTDKLGYITLPFEIRTQEYLLVLYDRLSNLRLNPQRDVSVKFPDEFKKYVEEVRTITAEQRKLKMELAKKKAERQRRLLYATFVDKDSGKESLQEKFPDATSIELQQHNFQWFGILEFETAEKSLEILKANPQIEIEGQTVKIVRTSPIPEDKDKNKEKSTTPKANRNTQSGRGGMRGGRGGSGGGMRSPHNQGPRSLLSMGPRPKFGGPGFMGGPQGQTVYNPASMGRYQDYGGGYGGGYGNQGFGGAGNFGPGGKRKSEYQDFGGASKKPFGGPRGGYGGGGGWNRF